MAEDQQRVVIISLAFIRIQAIGSVNDLVQCFENGSFEKLMKDMTMHIDYRNASL